MPKKNQNSLEMPRPTARGIFDIAVMGALLTAALLKGGDALGTIGRATEPIRTPIGNWVGQRFFELGQATNPPAHALGEQVERAPAYMLVALGVTGLYAAGAYAWNIIGARRNDQISEQPGIEGAVDYADYADPTVQTIATTSDQVGSRLESHAAITVPAEAPTF